MNRALSQHPSSAVRGRRAGAGVAISALVHLGVLAALVLTLVKPAPPALQPAMELTLVPQSAFPTPARPRPATVAPQQTPRRAQTTEPAPQAPITLARPQAQNQPAPPSLAARPPADMLQFYKKHVPGCGREDFILLPPEEQDRCRVRLAVAAAAERRGAFASDRNAPPISSLALERRRELERQMTRRRQFRETPGTDPYTACAGEGSNFGLGCLNPNTKAE